MTTQAVQADRPLEIRLTIESLLVIVIVLAGIMLRFTGLGLQPLSALEVPPAVDAWAMLGETVTDTSGASPLNLVITTTVMALGGVNEVSVRLASAVAGLLIVLLPLALRPHLGRLPVLLTMLLLAVLPGAVIPSRVVGGHMLLMLMVLAGLVAAVHYIESRQPLWAIVTAVLAALSLLADFTALIVWLCLAVGILLMIATDEEDHLAKPTRTQFMAALPTRAMTLAFVLTLILVGTGFGLVLEGFTAFAEQLGRFLNGFLTRPAGVVPLPVVLGLYEPLLLVFGLVGAWLASLSSQPIWRFVAGWGIASLLASILYQGFLPFHMIVTVLPLALLMAYTIQTVLGITFRGPRWAGIGFAGVTVVLLTLVIFSLSNYVLTTDFVSLTLGENEIMLSFQLVLAAMWLVLLLALWMTAATLWGPESGVVGMALGAAVMGLVMAFGHSADAALTRFSNPYDVAVPGQAQGSLLTMLDTMENISQLAAGDPHLAQVTVLGQQNSVVGWALHDFENVTFVPDLTAAVTSDLVIAPLVSSEPVLGSEYVGQSCVATRQWTLTDMNLNALIQWMIYHRLDVPVTEESVILWVREDLYRLGADETP